MMDPWFLDDDFWRTFGPVMFTDEKFAEAQGEIGAIAALCGISSGDVLDLACGPGRHAVPLAVAGFAVTALDTSHCLLQQGQMRAQQAGVEVQWRQQDMRALSDDSRFNAVLCLWTSFGYFADPEDDLRVLAAVRRALKPGGALLLDVVGKEYLLQHLQAVHLREFPDGVLLIERPILVDEMRRFNNQWLLIDGDRVHRANFEHAIYTAAELRDRLSRCGFEEIAVYGGLHGEPYDLEAERLVLVAR